MDIQPKLCVLAAFETHCKDELVLSWNSTISRYVCLYSRAVQDEKNPGKTERIRKDIDPLKCWDNAIEGNHGVEVNTAQSISFYLKELEQDELLAHQSFKVIHDTQRYRRRHRNPWSFF